jgi:hypothetical protein
MKTILALAAASGLALMSQGAMAAPAVQVDYTYGGRWYCGPECQRHRYWEHRRWERERAWRYHHRYYGYNHPYYYRAY